MAASPMISVRLPDGLFAKLTAESQKIGKPAAETARLLLAKALNAKGLTTMQTRGRKKLAEIE